MGKGKYNRNKIEFCKIINASKSSKSIDHYKIGELEAKDGYFIQYTDIKNIFAFIDDGMYLIQIEDPLDPIKDDNMFGIDIWKTTKINCVDMWRMDKSSTIQKLIKDGADPKCANYKILTTSIIRYYGVYTYLKNNWQKIAHEPWEKAESFLKNNGYIY